MSEQPRYRRNCTFGHYRFGSMMEDLPEQVPQSDLLRIRKRVRPHAVEWIVQAGCLYLSNHDMWQYIKRGEPIRAKSWIGAIIRPEVKIDLVSWFTYDEYDRIFESEEQALEALHDVLAEAGATATYHYPFRISDMSVDQMELFLSQLDTHQLNHILSQASI